MSAQKRAWVLKEAYPKVFDRLYQRRSSRLSNITLTRRPPPSPFGLGPWPRVNVSVRLW